MLTYISHSPAETEAFACDLAKKLRPFDVLAFRGPMGMGNRSRRRSTRMAARGLLVLSRIVAGVVRTVGGGLIGHRFIPLEVLQVVQELSRDYTTKRQNVHSRAAYISVKFAILKSSTKIERVSSTRRGAPRRKAPAIAARRPGIGP